MKRTALTASRLTVATGRRSASNAAWVRELNDPLSTTDPLLAQLIESEKGRQRDSLVLIASENFTSKSVFDALGSVMSNKYSEGYPGTALRVYACLTHHSLCWRSEVCQPSDGSPFLSPVGCIRRALLRRQ